MYAYLEGKFTYKSPAQVHVDVNGVGYEVNISLTTYSAIQGLTGGRLYTHLQVKEDAHTLYGFFERQEKEMFILLISVSGVGAATARMMLSSLRSEEVGHAIVQGNVRLLEGVKGIGKKTAERLVLELKDKVNKQTSGTDIIVPAGNRLEQDALTALTALGISRIQAEQSIQKIIRAEPGILHLEDLIKKALKVI
ncbi:Holliday junction branch migration protein RuvA [Ferruginibacter sp. HRS2-29]|uniref:Holliday junction branch migration protein RuvA n=1 Tax=Ferruginibacter sp. HRS2-29 TaxID=2487334 RepID=UPI0020CDF874|nr:Holliday junction branch migration protein RuvA [Ferruginibacter sp. HRS2-29]MCP9750665.1 Holliday junction branch migration protein RuvA [Ferruginibacter sp. HRS2-29]